MQPSPLHQQAIILREQGKSELALTKYDQALANYQTEHNQAGIIRCYLEKAIVCRHLYKKTQLSTYLDSAEQLIGLAETTDENQAFSSLISEQRGSLALAEENWATAVHLFNSLLENPQLSQDQRGNYLAHAGWATFNAGEQTTGQQQIEEGIALLKSNSAPSVDHNTHLVWLSGALLKLALCYAITQPTAVSDIMTAAHDLLAATNLTIRQQEWQELQEKLDKPHA